MPNINPRIRSLDDLLGVARKVENTAATEDKPAQPGNNEIQMLPPEIIRGFRGHPFRLYEGDRFNDLVDSVSENGVLSPTIIRKIEPDENGFEYEMLAGHNRQNAAIAAKRLLPCIVKENLSDQDAWIYVIETNVLQRSFSEMFPSERAAVLALRYSKMICQGRRNDIIEELKRLENPDEIRENKTCGIDCHKSKSRDVVGAEYNLKGRAVANYLRINELSAALKIRIDDGEFTIAAAVQLSYLAQEEQQMVEAVLSESEYMLVLLRHIADYVIVDCTSVLTGNVLATAALEVADDVLRVCGCDLKAISYFASYLPLIEDRKFKPEQHIRVVSNTRPYPGGMEYENSFGGVKYRLPYLPIVEEQAATLKLLEPLAGKEAKSYEPVIAAIAAEVFGDGK